ncbi:MAG: SpoIIE family protein phosphatase [Alphaproteobacteria bacterium]
MRAAFASPGRAPALALLVCLVLLRAADPSLLEEIRLRGFDLEERLYPRPHEPLPVHIVAIDEKSLQRYGQWPWPRTLVARLVRAIADGHPNALGVDIAFIEPDRLSPGRLIEAIPDIPPALAQELAQLPPNETALANALRRVPTVLGLLVTSEPSQAPRKTSSVTMIREKGGDPRQFLFAYPTLVRDLPEISAAEQGRGALVAVPDHDGVVRRIPLVIAGEGHLVAAFALESLRVALRFGSIEIVTGRDGVEGIVLGDSFLGTDRQGRAYPHFSNPHALGYVPAADLLDGSYDSAGLEGEIVLLGVTGLALGDVWQTPLGPMDGVVIHAQLAESIITGDLLRRFPLLDRIEIGLVVAVGLTTILLLPYRRPQFASAALLGLAALLLGSGFVAFRFGNLLLDSAYPTFSALATFAVMLSASLRAAEGARRLLAVELAQEHELKLRLEGELNAARSIQMGLLPRRFPGRPEHREIDVHALIEPARMVGGDLYDVLMLDERRLFFAIADVSGHGVPAALFMAMSMGVLRAATLRYGEALDQVLAEANAKISAASADMAAEGANMMFVTVFAAVLDVTTGLIVYASAGHDSPFVLHGRGPALHLATVGGPPLGAVDDFPYPVGRHQLAPGELVLLYTDGVTEAIDQRGAFFTAARLQQLLASAPQGDPKAIIGFVQDNLRRFIGAAEHSDDITMLAVRWNGPAAAAG